MKVKITLLFWLVASTTFSQYSWTDGELILKNGDTLVGQIKLSITTKSSSLISINSKEKVFFRKGKKDKVANYRDNEVATVIFKSSKGETVIYQYVSTSEKKKNLFRIVSIGKATLYARSVNIQSSGGLVGGMVPNTEPGNFWYFSPTDFNEFYVLMEKDSIALPLVTAGISRSFKKRAAEYFSDCSSVVQKLKNKTYTKNDIKAVIDEYNVCR